jgi:serine/threonine protein kinase
MPVSPAIPWTTGSLWNPATVKSDEVPKFPVFWDAFESLEGTDDFSSLVFEKHLGEGAQFQVDLCGNLNNEESGKPELVAVKTAKITARDNLDEAPGEESSLIIRHDDNHRKKDDLRSVVREIQVLSHPPLQSHPNIMRLLGSSWTANTVGTSILRVIVEYSSLGSLFEMLTAPPLLTTQEKLDITFDIASGLERVHKCGIVHGDMKLSNIMVFPGERPACRFTAKLSDFGSSIAADDPDQRKTYWGSPGYRPPDILTESTMSIADLQSCDIFALGLCTWEILNNGRRFFEADQGKIPSGQHVPSTHPYLVRVDAFLSSISLTVERGRGRG